MTPLQTAILEFLANEFQLQPENVSIDLNFKSDLNLSPQALTDLLQRLQDALDFILPEDKIQEIHTVEDLLSAAGTDEADTGPDITTP